MKLILVRHADATNNHAPKNEIHGHSTAGLTRRGRRQASMLSESVGMFGEVDAVICADTARCYDTARIVYPHISPQQNNLLRERDFGDLEGVDGSKSFNLNGQTYTPAAIRDVMASLQVPAPGGESWNDVRNRASSFLSELRSQSSSSIAVFAHKGSIRSILELLTNQPWNKPINHCEPVVVTLSDESAGISDVLKDIINANAVLKQQVLSIYGIGSLAKQRPNVRDIDLNIFVEQADFRTINAIAQLQERVKVSVGKEVDVNVLARNNFDNNMLNSELFVHRGRHALFLYETVTVPCLLYGADILKQFKPHYSSLLFESYKLAMTQVHRMNKEYLAKNRIAAIREVHKYARYTCEFAMIFKGMSDPYTQLNAEIFLKHYPEMASYALVVRKIFAKKPAADEADFETYYNFAERLTAVMHQRLLRFIATIANPIPDHTAIANDALTKPDAHFVFPTSDELQRCKEYYDRQPDHAKISPAI